jgi:hypothetical protein
MSSLLPFTDLPPRPPEPPRQRTAENWRQDDPDTYEQVIERILGLDLNFSELAREFAPQRRLRDGTQGVAIDTMRRAINAMIVNDERLGRLKLRELRLSKGEIVQAELVDKVGELTGKTHKADALGGAAMAMKLTRDTINAEGGAPSIVIKHEHTVTIDNDTARRREEIARRLAAERSESTPVIDLIPEMETNVESIHLKP